MFQTLLFYSDGGGDDGGDNGDEDNGGGDNVDNNTDNENTDAGNEDEEELTGVPVDEGESLGPPNASTSALNEEVDNFNIFDFSSNSNREAADGWTNGLTEINPFTAINMSDGSINPYVGYDVNPYTNGSPTGVNINAYTGGQNVEPYTGIGADSAFISSPISQPQEMSTWIQESSGWSSQEDANQAQDGKGNIFELHFDVTDLASKQTKSATFEQSDSVPSSPMPSAIEPDRATDPQQMTPEEKAALQAYFKQLIDEYGTQRTSSSIATSTSNNSSASQNTSQDSLPQTSMSSIPTINNDWTTQTALAFPTNEHSFFPIITHYDSGNTLVNLLMNGIIFPINNTINAVANLPIQFLGAVGDIDDKIKNSPYAMDWQNFQDIMPLSKSFGFAAELPGGLSYLDHWLTNNTAIRNFALQSLTLFGFGGTFGSGTSKIRSAAQAAVIASEAGLSNAGKGNLPFYSYNVRSSISKALEFRGANMEAAHMLPQAIGKYIPGYSPGRALVTPLPRVAHTAWDQGWIHQWNEAVRNGTPMTAGQVYTMLDNALTLNTELTPEIKGTISWQLYEEMFSDLGLEWNSTILPPK